MPLGLCAVRTILVVMKALTAIAAAFCALPFSAFAQSALEDWRADPTRVFDATEVDLDALIWEVRPLVVFAQSPNDPQFQRQMDLLSQDASDLARRDIMVITDTDPAARTDARLALRPRAFMLALIGKDGQTKLRKPAPWDVRELSRSIDKMPLRQQEIRDRRIVDPDL